MEVGIVRQVDIEHEMRTAYLDYAMSVITARALPDVRDGLKPVQRRILYAMEDMGLQHDKPYKKSARIVGEVLGKYHPHGDMAVYDAMTRLAQDFTMRYPLVDGQGNFGSVDGDNPAAMRYTEARLSAVAAELLADLDKDTVDFSDNFDGTLKEPTVLPARLPNLLLNGASGIAVGMATNVPPHNLSELADAIAYLVDNWRRVESVAVDELLDLVKGPDFPTGGTILGLEGIRGAYATGAGNVVVRAKAHFEDAGGGKSLIIVTELPYQVGKAALIEKIAELVREKKIDTISDLRDESDRQGMRMVVELKRGAEPRPTLMDLYRYTPMQSTFNANMLALVDGEPRVLSLRRALQLFIEHRQEVITRRTGFELERARMHAHILEGLTKALDHLDAVIKTIRESQTADTARQNLMTRFKFSEIQAQAILDLQLRRLAALERKKIEQEYADTLKRIEYLENLLANPKKILGLVKSEALELKERYGDARRTRISAKEAEQIQVQDLIPEQDTYVGITQKGQIRRAAEAGEFFSATGRDATVELAATNTLHSVLLCTDKGRCFTLQVHQVPESQTGGVPLANVLNLEPDESVRALVAAPSFAEGAFLTLCTSLGRVKRIAISEFASVRAGGLIAIGLEPGDELRFALVTSGGQELTIVTAGGQALRFGEDEVRPMGRGAGGVNGIKLDEGDEVVGLNLVKPGAALAVVSEKGWAKRTPLAEYPLQGRYGKGVVALPAKYLAQTGKLAAATVVAEGDDLGVATSSGATIRTAAGTVGVAGRALRGSPLRGLRSSERVIAMVAVPGRAQTAGASPASKAKPEPATRVKKASTTSRPRSKAPAKTASTAASKRKRKSR
ncbi:MAG TPA: DNA gyrase subunit A [Anaerolineae bacterium]|nr:DNA gyrase subunit A [Anaerolineae bacterium]